MKEMSYKPVPFALGAVLAPGIVGFASRVLASPRVMSVPPIATRGVMFAATTAGMLATGNPFLIGAFIGQVSPTMDMISEAAAHALLGPGEAAAAAAAPAALKGLSSAEAYAERAAAGQVTSEDIAEMQRLKQELTGGRLGASYQDMFAMRGISDQRRVGYSTGEVASSRRVTRF